MSLTTPQAIDEMYTLFNTAWLAGSAAIVGTVPAIRWDGVEEEAAPPVDAYWCRVSTEEIDASQSTLKSGIAPNEAQRYTAVGLLFVQLFCPKTDAKAKERGELLAELARNAFRGVETPGGVWFRNPRATPLPSQGNALRFNIVVEYEYDSIAQ